MFTKYRYVYAVYEEQNFTRAAKKLFISQPSLSAAIKNIEKKVGAPLFERYGSGARLTEIGREYINTVEKLMRIEKEFSDKLSDIYSLESGHITVGGTNYLSSFVLPGIITRFSALYPNIEVTLEEAKSKNLIDMIENEQLDIVVDSFDETMDAYCGYPLVNERILLCVPANRRVNDNLEKYQISPDVIYNGSANLESFPPVPVEVFCDEKFILLKNGNDMYERAMTIFSKSNISPKVLFSVDQMNIAYSLAQSGMGLCFATDTFFRYGKFQNNVVLYNVGEEHCSRTLYIAHKKNKYCSKAMTEFIRIAKEVVK